MMTHLNERAQSFNERYQGNQSPPWNTGKPQPAFVALEREGEIHGRTILDIGCGTGENSLFFASRGFEVTGIDFAPNPVEKAQRKAAQRKLPVTFLIHNALNLQSLGSTFDTVIDSGLFHTLSDKERLKLVGSLRSVLNPGGTYLMLCFSDREPPGWGPRRVSKKEIRATFNGSRWRVNYIEESFFRSNHEFDTPDEIRAWLASITRMDRRSTIRSGKSLPS
jgi:cyclopropane fatty-acyl-phospholipid synthase-like methyltransferase